MQVWVWLLFLANEGGDTSIANGDTCYLHKIFSTFPPLFSKVFVLFSISFCEMNFAAFLTVIHTLCPVLFMVYATEFVLCILLGCLGPISSVTV